MAKSKSGMRVVDWLITLLALTIPIINIILLIVWAYGVGNSTRTNFCRAILIWAAIIAVLCILLFSGFISGISSTIIELVK